MKAVAVLAVLVLACDAVAPTPSSLPPQSPAATAAPAATGTPRPTQAALPNGLERRTAMPALIDGELDPCLPLCRTGLVRPGAVPVGDRYQTQWFAGGYMTLSFPEPWKIGEDSTGELGIVLPEEEAAAPAGETPYHVAFTVDIWPAKNGRRVAGVASTAAAIEAWFRGDENYRVLRAKNTRIGVLPARAIDVALSPSAPMEYPDCGAPCVDGLTFEQFGDMGGIRGKDVYRYYLADINYGGENHLLAVEVQTRSLKHLDALAPRVEAVFDTVRLPAHAAP